MIYLKNHKLIFIKAGRVGGSSFEVALSNFSNGKDIITPLNREEVRTNLGFAGPRNFKYSIYETFSISKILFLKHLLKGELPRKYYNHMPATEIKKRIGEKIWNNCIKISIIRNPFDQIISSFYRTVKKNNLKNLDFNKYYLENQYLLSWNHRHYEIEGKNIIDFFIRFENFEEDILNLENKIPGLKGIYKIFRNINAAPYPGSRPKNIDIKKFYNKAPQVKNLIETSNKKYIEKFNYHL